jgi:CHAT domain-containing protein
MRTLHGPRVLHFSTHGVFDYEPAICTDVLGAEDSLALETSYGRHVRSLTRAGLALAGIGTASETRLRDGFLTAFDVVGLDLTGTDLVFLAACDSGRGVAVAGEGAVGLGRSFRVAGARQVIMSLWRLRDKEAQRQMSAFYALYRQGNAADALCKVQRERVRSLRAALRHAPPPAMWAALVAQGA